MLPAVIRQMNLVTWNEYITEYSKTDRIVIGTGNKKTLVEVQDLITMIPSNGKKTVILIDPFSFNKELISTLLTVAYSDIEVNKILN